MKKYKKIFSKTLILFICLSLILPFCPIGVPKTQAWDAIPSVIIKQAMENLQKTINGITLNAVKQMAMQMVLEEVNAMVDDLYDTGGGIIRDWRDFLRDAPEAASKKYMNDYLSQITQGRDSSRYRNMSIQQVLSYSKNYEGFGGMNQYQFALIQKAKAEGETAATGSDSSSVYSDFRDTMDEVIQEQDYYKNPPKVDCSGCNNLSSNFSFDLLFKCTSTLCYGPTRKAFFASIQQKDLEDRKEQARIEATSSGVTGAKDKKTGKILTPAGTIESIQNKAATLGMDALATAQSIPEVVAAAVITAVDRSIKQGIGAIKERAQREISNVRKQTTNQIKQQTQQIGPQAVFQGNNALTSGFSGGSRFGF